MTVAATTGYATNAEYLQAEFAWLECLVQREILWSRGNDAGRGESFRGMYISDHEVVRLMQDQTGEETSESAALRARAAALRVDIDAWRQIPTAANLMLPRLSSTFHLTPFEEQVLLGVLAPEVDGRFGTLYAYLQNDLTRRRPSIDLLARLLCESADERIASLDAFSSHATLLRVGLLRPLDNSDDPLRNRALMLDEPILNLLLGWKDLPPDLTPCLQQMPPAHGLASLRWSPENQAQWMGLIVNFVDSGAPTRSRLIFHFHGRPGIGKRALAGALCREIGVPLLRLDLREVVSRFENFEGMVRVLFRQALLQQAALYLENFDLLLGDEEKRVVQRGIVRRAIDEFAWLVFVGTEEAWSARDYFHPYHLASVELPPPDLAERCRLWPAIAAEFSDPSPEFEADIDWEELAAKFRLTPGEMIAALQTASDTARLRNPAKIAISSDDLHRGLRAHSNQKLSTLARKLKPRYSWTDIILSPNARSQMRELCAHIRHRKMVHMDWGFDRKLSLGKGLSVLFSGQSGVGKTMAVEVIANELRLEVFKIDLSKIVSKYIGETEKQLAKVFEEAESSNAILFFDEADALFGKRSEVKDAQDRFANIEINYLLQRMEEFEGLVILATNLKKNIDDGFFRRMQFVIEFPFPDAAHRYKIWKQHMPAEAPAGENIDFNFLAERFNLSGGNIKNVVVNAAFLAAQNGRVIRMEHLIHATKREYEKIGRLCTDQDFAPYQLAYRSAE